MEFKMPEGFNTLKKADPDKVRKQLLSGRNINVNMKWVVILFAVFIMLIAAVSAGVVISEVREKETTLVVSGSEAESTTVFAEEESSLLCNILIAFTKEENEGLQLLCILNADEENGEIKMPFISPDERVDVSNYPGTMSEHLQSGGMAELLWAVGHYASISIERYIQCDEDGFTRIMKYTGETEFDIKEEISHSYNGINFIIEEGNQKLTADMMLKYFVYLCDTSEKSQNKIAELFSLVAKKLIPADSQDELNKNYSKIINNIKTDISAMDITHYFEDVSSFVKNGICDSFTVVSSAADF